MKICVAFFGITRSLSHTKDSILENVLSPLSAFFDLEIVAHFYENAFDETAEGGLNDRFAFCRGERAKKAYACRGRHALEFCQRTGGALQSEQLLRYSVMRYGIKTQDLNATASRVRADGRIVKEDFARRSFRTWRQRRRLIKDWDFSDLDDQ